MASGRAPVRAFWTRQPLDPLDFVRTFGAVVEAAGHPDLDPMDYAQAEAPQGCARGKISLLTQGAEGPQVACFQFGDAAHRALLVGCSNGAAAAAARAAELAGHGAVDLRMSLPSGIEIQARARVQGDAAGEQGARVVQTWLGLPLTVQAADLGDGRRYALCSGPLNDYLMVEVAPGEDPAAFTVAGAMVLAERFGLTAEPLRSRIAVLDCAGGGPPRARFFTCGEREHPSAPLTGLAVLAVAGRRLGWPGLDRPAHLQTSAGLLPFPGVAEHPGGAVDVDFPELIVHLGAAGGGPA